MLARIVLILAGLAFFSPDLPCFAQNSKGNRSGSAYSMDKRRDRKKIICPVFEHSRYPYHGIGLKLGDPFAITYKYYMSERFGIAVDFGKTASGLYNRYYKEKFYEYIDVDTASEGARVDYLSHRMNYDWVAELKFLWHVDAKGITPGLKMYFGVGTEIRNTQIDYQYYFTSVVNGSEVNKLGSFERQRHTFGPQVSLGIEYSYFQIPVSAFMEVELFHDISLDPGWQRFQGGAGLRYIF
jgi:hypothetical protein